MKPVSLSIRSILFPVFLCSIFIFSGCKKQLSDKSTPVQTGNPPPPPTGNSCSATLADAENIQIFPADNPWNQDISNAAIDPASSQIIAIIGNSPLHPDFGSGLWDGAPIGIPYVVVCGSQAKIAIDFRANSYDDNYGDESDPGPYPIPLTAPIEGNATGDALRVRAVDVDNP